MGPREQMDALEPARPWNPAPAMPNVLAPATQPTAAPQPKAGIGGEGWNEDFDQAWGGRMMKQYGVTMEDLRDPETRRWLNRQQRNKPQPTAQPAAQPKPTTQAAARPGVTSVVQSGGESASRSTPAGQGGPVVNPAELASGRPRWRPEASTQAEALRSAV